MCARSHNLSHKCCGQKRSYSTGKCISALLSASLKLVHTQEFFHRCLQTTFDFWRDLLVLFDAGQNGGLTRFDVPQPQRLESEDFFGRNLVQVTSRARPKRGDDLRCRHWNKLLLL